LYELSLKHDGIQVITLNVDENPGELEPFLKSRKYTFPVVMAAGNPVLSGRKAMDSNSGPWIGLRG
jgi:glutaredoxin